MRCLKMFVAVVLCFSFIRQAAAQQVEATDEVITVKVSDLPLDLRTRLKERQQVQAIGERVKQYGEWVGIGKEVGIAVNEGLEAVTDKASKFSETTPGKVTIAVIVWKLVGKDLLGILIGIPLVILATYIYWWSWKNLYRGHSVFVGFDTDGKKKLYEFKRSVYEVADGENEKNTVLFLGGAMFVVYFGVVAIIVANVVL